MPSKSTKPISGRVDNETYFKLMELAKNKRMTLSQFVGETLLSLTTTTRILGQISTDDEFPEMVKRTPKKVTSKREPIPEHVFNPNPLNDYGRVGVDIAPDISGYYTEEQVYRLELSEKTPVRGKWTNNLAIPKDQLFREGSAFFPINETQTTLLEAYVTGNSAYPILYKVVANSFSILDENNQECVTFDNRYDGLRFGTCIEKDSNGNVVYQSYNKWYYSFEALNGKIKNVILTLI